MKRFGGILLCTAVLAGVLGGCAPGPLELFGGKAELVNEQTVSLENVEHIVVGYLSETVTFYRGEGESLELREYMNKDKAEYHAQIREEDGVLTIAYGKRPSGSLNSYVEIWLPEGYTGALEAATVSGSLVLEDTLGVTKLDAQSVSGAVRVAGLTGEGLIATTSGHITVSSLVGNLEAESVSGGIDVEQAVGGGRLQTHSGRISAAFSQVTDALTLESTSGSLNVSLPEDGSYRFTADTASGGIHTPFDDLLEGSKHHKSASIGPEEGTKVSMTSTSGGIRVSWS